MTQLEQTIAAARQSGGMAGKVLAACVGGMLSRGVCLEDIEAFAVEIADLAWEIAFAANEDTEQEEEKKTQFLSSRAILSRPARSHVEDEGVEPRKGDEWRE